VSVCVCVCVYVCVCVGPDEHLATQKRKRKLLCQRALTGLRQQQRPRRLSTPANNS